AVGEVVQVGPQVPGLLAGAGALEVHDLVDARVERRDVDGAGGFYQHGVAAFEQQLGEAEGVAVDERLAAGELDERRAELRDAVEDLVERHALAAVERVLGVAPYAAQGAAGQPHERARQPRPGALALDGVEDLRDAEESGGRCLLVHYGIEPPAWSNGPGESRNFGRGRGRPFRPSAPPGRPPYLPTATRVGELRVHCGRGRSRRGRLHGPRGTPSPSP